MHRPDLGAGFVVCFRRLDTPSHVFAAPLGGIDPSARYTVETYDGPMEQVAGRALAKFAVELKAPRSFRLVFYSRAGRQAGHAGQVAKSNATSFIAGKTAAPCIPYGGMV